MTPFEDVYSLALAVIRDYRLDKLAQIDYQAFLTEMQNILIRSIPYFLEPLTSLDYDLTVQPPSFVNSLSILEQSILADFMVLNWFMKDVNDVTQINLKLQGADKKTHSENANLKEKAKYLVDIREQARQRINDYQLQGDNFNKIFGI